MKKQQGFTLIELMIVVAVIGVLSAIAIPQYEKYVAKSQAASALATISALKTNVESYIAENTDFPAVSATSAGDAALGMPASELGTLTLATGNASGADGTITYSFTNASSLLNTKTLSMNRDGSGNWKCTTTADTNLVPKTCKP
ncbi:pilin [Photobacterium leiognathi]|uniref:pilin n=1 Tax=Photobacterium leiognathi TaxID=553611 RepID=UPI002980B6B8|nr:pilin [Photobacterium leiognathi]